MNQQNTFTSIHIENCFETNSAFMGQWLSAKLDYSFVSEGDTTLDGTPKDCKKILHIDPRSPTVDIDRTPIEVNSVITALRTHIRTKVSTRYSVCNVSTTCAK
ncbi:hypothetical protein OSTOST_06129, partial [Ostertagia ostertagi]